MTPEGKVKAAVKAWLTEQGYWWFMPMGTGYGRAGIPDFICCSPFGDFVAIECKALGKKPTAFQERELKDIVAHAGSAWVATQDPEGKLVLTTVSR
jgi:hypothetical protein